MFQFQTLPTPAVIQSLNSIGSISYDDYWVRCFAVFVGVDAFRLLLSEDTSQAHSSYAHDMILLLIDRATGPLHPYVQPCIVSFRILSTFHYVVKCNNSLTLNIVGLVAVTLPTTGEWSWTAVTPK